MTPAQNRARFHLTAPTVREFHHNRHTYKVTSSSAGLTILIQVGKQWRHTVLDDAIRRAAMEAITK